MRDKNSRICKSIFVILVVTILTLAVLTPGIAGKSNFNANNFGKKVVQNKLRFIRLFNNMLGRILSNRPRLLQQGY
jgi:hypothetical protein